LLRGHESYTGLPDAVLAKDAISKNNIMLALKRQVGDTMLTSEKLILASKLRSEKLLWWSKPTKRP
jgi:hypothetical protein